MPRYLCRAFGAFFIVLFTASAHGQSCANLDGLLDDARRALRDVRFGLDPDTAGSQAREVRQAIEYATSAALNCRCPRAADALRRAGSFARFAEETQDSKAYRDFINRTVLTYNEAIDLFSNCR